MNIFKSSKKYILFPGWYMVETYNPIMSSRLNVSIVVTNLFFSKSNITFPIVCIGGETSKRIIKVKGISTIEISINDKENIHNTNDVSAGDILVNYSYMIPSFAKNRMLKKLKALHPYYKVRGQLRKIDKFTENSFNHYCDLFDQNENIVSYDKYYKRMEVMLLDASSLLNLHDGPVISIVMPVYNPGLDWLKQAITSVINQNYQRWQLCIADDASTNSAVRPLLEEYASMDSRINLIFRKTNGHISAASNSALSLCKGEYVALMDQDDLLPVYALSIIASELQKFPNARLVYSDEDKISDDGIRFDPYFKPDWNEDLFLSQNLISHFGIYDIKLLEQIGGFRVGYEGSQDYDLALRCIQNLEANEIRHIPHVLYHWRVHDESTASSNDAKPYAKSAGCRAIADYIERTGLHASVESTNAGYRVKYLIHEPMPLVSIIIPTKDRSELLSKCIYSIIARTAYANYEIVVVNNGSTQLSTIDYFEKVSRILNVRILNDNRPFNYSMLNNIAVREAKGSIIVLLNNDVEVINSDWLAELVSHAQRPKVGAVGAKLYYSDETVQHAGVILGIHGVAGHIHRYFEINNHGYCGRASLIQSFSAVTGACMAVRKDVYLEVGGMNEDLPVACNDIDFCLKIKEAGYTNIWTPYAELYHHESASRGLDDTPEKIERSKKEVTYMQKTWGDIIKNDPAYNPNLTLDFEDFSLAWPPRMIDHITTSSGANH